MNAAPRTGVEVFADLLERGGFKPRMQGDKGSAHCPCHEDRTPSMSFAAGHDKPVVAHCNAASCGADLPAMLDALKATKDERDAILGGTHNAHASDAAAGSDGLWTYFDEAGQPLFRVHRKGKAYPCQHANGTGWEWGMGDVRPVLYQLPEVLAAARLSEEVFIPEGEKCVEYVRALGLTSTTNPGGAGKWRDEFSATLACACRVYVLEDNDDAGRRHGDAVAKSLKRAGIMEVRRVAFPELPIKGDVADWLATLGDLDVVEKRRLFLARCDVGSESESPAAPSGAESEKKRTGRVLVPNLDLEAIARDGIPALDWIAPGWLLPGDVVMLVGDSFAGKSTTASAIAVAAATGGTAFGTIAFTRAMPVLYFDSETGNELLARQLLRLNGGQAIPSSKLAAFSMLEFSLVDGGLDDLAATIEAAGAPCLVILDSVAALFGLRDENSASEVGPVLQALRELAARTGSVFVVLHHATKPSSDSRFQRARKDRARGSSAFRGQCTVMMFQELTGRSTAVLEQSKRRGAPLRSVVITYSEPKGENGPIELSGEPIELSETKAEQLEDLLLEILEALAPGEDATTAQLQSLAHAAGHQPKSVSRMLGRLAKPSHGPPRVLKPKKGHWVVARPVSATETDRTGPVLTGEEGSP